MSTTKPKAVLLALAKVPWFEEMEAVLEGLNSKADVVEISTAEVASALLTGNERPVVLAIDQAFTEDTFARQKAEVCAPCGGIFEMEHALTSL